MTQQPMLLVCLHKIGMSYCLVGPSSSIRTELVGHMTA